MVFVGGGGMIWIMGNVYAMDTFCHGHIFHTENNYVKSKIVCAPVNGEYRLKWMRIWYLY